MIADWLGGSAARRVILVALLLFLYVFLYAPICYVIYTSFAEDIVWPFPPAFTLQAYTDVFESSLYSDALWNSILIGLGSGLLSTLLAMGGAIGLLRYPSKHRRLALFVFRRRSL